MIVRIWLGAMGVFVRKRIAARSGKETAVRVHDLSSALQIAAL
jgi:hypothetical protein